MAYSHSNTRKYRNGRAYHEMTWIELTESVTSPDTVLCPDLSKVRVKFYGTWGVGGHCKLQGSIDGTTWFDLKDDSGSTIDATANTTWKMTTEVYKYLRCIVTAGTGVDVDVLLLAFPF